MRSTSTEHAPIRSLLLLALPLVVVSAAACGGRPATTGADGGSTADRGPGADASADSRLPPDLGNFDARADSGPLCAQASGVVVLTDRTYYAAGDAVRVTLANCTDHTVFVDNCTAFNREHRERNAWFDSGPDAICGTGGAALELAPAAEISHQMTLGGGVWRLGIDIGEGCTANGPFSSGSCTSITRHHSPEITVMPSAKQCLDIDSKYRAALPAALSCNSALSRPQCDKPVDTGLYCPCTRFVEQTAALDVVRQQWADALCPKISPPGPCTGQPCPKPGPLLCINDTCQ